jgi:hypothetical protein
MRAATPVDGPGATAYFRVMRRLFVLGVLFASCAHALAQAAPTGNEALAMKRQGYVFYEGRWRLPREVVYLQRGRALSYPKPNPVAEPTPPPVKMPLADVPARAVRANPAQYSLTPGALVTCAPSIGLFTLHLQRTQLLGLDTVTVGFGNGQGRLQLPRTQSISIGTTVALPLR